MAPLIPITEVERESEFAISEYLGRVSFGQHSTLQPGQFRDAINWDIFDTYLKSRRGSQFLRPASSPAKWAATDAPGAIPWDVGSEEYLIAQVGTSFYAQSLLTPGNPVLIQTFSGGAFTVGTTAPADLFVHGNRLFIIHPTGNKVVEWSGAIFRGRALGMSFPYIESFQDLQGQINGGRHVYAIEKVYQVSGADFLVSSPNRKDVNGHMTVAGIANILGKTKLTLRAAELTGDSLWTHLRLYRSKGLDADVSDPTAPIEPQGVEDELYEVALITRAEWERGSTLAIATGGSLPAGNARVEVGGGFIIDDNPDAVLFDFIGLDRIELIPLPAAVVGCFHGQRIWVATDDSNDILYSNARGTKYSELYDPLNVKDTGDDGLAIIRLFSLERDLLVLKESKTGRISAGNPDQNFEILDQRIGIAQRQHAAHLAGVGIVAITNDDSNFMIFGADLLWTKNLNGQDIATPIRDAISALTAANVRFLYINGKILLSEGNGVVHALHTGYGRGWTRYLLLINTSRPLNFFTFAGGQRAAVMSGGAYTLEIEVDNLDTDDSIVNDSLANTIPLEFVTHMYQAKDGAQLLEQEWYYVNAKLATPLRAIPFMNGLPWPSQTAEVETSFIVPPATFAQGALQDRQYRLFLEPQPMGSFLWNRFLGNFLHFRLETEAPAIFKKQGMRVIVDEDDAGFLAFDPYQDTMLAPAAPVWAGVPLLHLPFDADSATAKDISGRGRDYVYSGAGRTFDATLAPAGGQSLVGAASSGYTSALWDGLDHIGDGAAGINSDSLTFEWIGSFPTLAAALTLMQGGNATKWWRLRVNTNGSLEFQLSTSGLSYKWTTAAGVIAAGSTLYTLQFVLYEAGSTGQFYAAAKAGSYTKLTTTRATLTAGIAWTRINASVAWVGAAQRLSPGFTTHAGKMWLMGGNRSGLLNDVWSSADGITWTQETAAAGWSARSKHAVCSHAGKLYVAGGEDGGGVVSDVWSSADGITWTQETANFGGPRRGHRMISFLSKLWIIGGDDGGGQPRNDIRSSPTGATWTLEKANAPVVLPPVYTNHFSPRSIFGLAVFDSHMWVMGGSDFGEIYGLMNDLYKSADGVTWTTVIGPALGPWSARHSMALLSVGGKLSLYGGQGTGGTARSDAWESSADGATWSQLTAEGSSWVARAPTAWVLNDQAYVGPGENGDVLTADLWVRGNPASAAGILPAATGKVSHLRILRGARSDIGAEQFHNLMKGQA